MSEVKKDVCVLLADVSGSTALYESVGDLDALSQISEYIGLIKQIVNREGGNFIHSKGDDILCTFDDVPSAITATRNIMAARSQHALKIHAGLHFGPIVQTEDDIYGDTVNLAARLASTANNGEVLISEALVIQAGKAASHEFRYLNTVEFKGKSEPTAVYTLLAEQSTSIHTQISGLTQNYDVSVHPGSPLLKVELDFGGKTYTCTQERDLKIGRAPECDIRQDEPWVSRQHAVIEVRQNKVNLVDRSSGGTFVRMSTGHEISVIRESILITGAGQISLTLPSDSPKANPIYFRVLTG